jgi:hypothetical protein
MLKSSSLYLYSSILGTFWLKIEQFWPFEEISIFSNGGHLGYRSATYITGFFMNFELLPILTDLQIRKKGDGIKKKSSPLKLLSQSQPNFAEMILGCSSSKIVSGISEHRPRWPPQPPFSIFSLVAILVGIRDHRTQFWKGAIQGPFHQSLRTSFWVIFFVYDFVCLNHITPDSSICNCW